ESPGSIAATGVVLPDVQPADLVFQVSSVTKGPAVQANGVITCNLGTLAAGASAELTVVAIPGVEADGIVTDTATVSGNEADSVLANNSDWEDTLVIPKSDLTLTLSAVQVPVIPANDLLYQFSVF